MGYSPWRCKESDIADHRHTHRYKQEDNRHPEAKNIQEHPEKSCALPFLLEILNLKHCPKYISIFKMFIVRHCNNLSWS